MANMLMVDQRMASRTNNHQIFRFIVHSVFVSMMYPKNFFYRMISTDFTALYKTPPFISFSNVGKVYITRRFSLIFPTTLRIAKFISLARRTHEFFLAIYAIILDRALSLLRSMITQARTVLRPIAAGRNMLKSLSANLAAFSDPYCAKPIFTFPRTVLCFIKAVYGDVKRFIATQTTYKFSSMRFRHAIIQG